MVVIIVGRNELRYFGLDARDEAAGCGWLAREIDPATGCGFRWMAGGRARLSLPLPPAPPAPPASTSAQPTVPAPALRLSVSVLANAPVQALGRSIELRLEGALQPQLLDCDLWQVLRFEIPLASPPTAAAAPSAFPPLPTTLAQPQGFHFCFHDLLANGDYRPLTARIAAVRTAWLP